MRQMKIVKGDKALEELMKRMRPGTSIYWTGAFGHCDDILIEVVDMLPKGKSQYERFYVCSMQHHNGWLYEHSDASIFAYLAVQGESRCLGELFKIRYPDYEKRVKQLTW